MINGYLSNPSLRDGNALQNKARLLITLDEPTENFILKHEEEFVDGIQVIFDKDIDDKMDVQDYYWARMQVLTNYGWSALSEPVRFKPILSDKVDMISKIPTYIYNTLVIDDFDIENYPRGYFHLTAVDEQQVHDIGIRSYSFYVRELDGTPIFIKERSSYNTVMVDVLLKPDSVFIIESYTHGDNGILGTPKTRNIITSNNVCPVVITNKQMGTLLEYDKPSGADVEVKGFGGTTDSEVLFDSPYILKCIDGGIVSYRYFYPTL
jgi:hypothetical protein